MSKGLNNLLNDIDRAKAPGEVELELYSKFIIELARSISTDGGRTAKLKGAVVVLDQPIAYKEHKDKQ